MPAQRGMTTLTLATLLACGPAAQDSTTLDFEAFTILAAEAMPSVMTVSWETSVPATCSVAFGPPGDLRYRASASGEPASSHSVQLVGLVPNSDAVLVVTAETEEGSTTSQEQHFRTGALPAAAPTVTRETHDEEQSWGGFTVVPIRTDGVSWISIFDEQGANVWSYEARGKSIDAQLALDGRGVIFNLEDPGTGGDESGQGASLTQVDWDGQELWSRVVVNSHHHFAQLDGDRFAMLGITDKVVTHETTDKLVLRGDSILEFDREGEPEVVWDIFDHVDPDEATCTEWADSFEDNWVLDWSHGNYLELDRERGAYYVSLRHLDAIIAVDTKSHEQLWTVANDWGDYQSAPGEPNILWPHSAEMTEEGLLVFNQTYAGATDSCSHTVLLELDADTGSSTTTWQYGNPECSQIFFLGNSRRLPNGNILNVFSQAGIIDEVTPQGAVVSRLSTDMGAEFSYADRVESLAVSPTAEDTP